MRAVAKRSSAAPRRGYVVDPYRSSIMRAVRSKGTGPELAVRSALRLFKHRITFNHPSLPGRPDIVVKSLRKAIFVHGCFWHGHTCKRGSRVPINNRLYWIAKIQANRERYRRSVRRLRAEGWSTLTIWECQLRDGAQLSIRLGRFLRDTLLS